MRSRCWSENRHFSFFICLLFTSDVFVRKSPSVSARFGCDPNCMGAFYPFFRGHYEAVKSGLFSKPVEFDGFKIWVV